MDWLTLIVAVLSSSVLVKLIDIIASLIGKKRDKKNVHTRAQQMMILSILRNSASEYISAGHIDGEHLRSYVEMYEIYKELGGNGYADTIYKKVCALPISSKDGEEE